MDIRTPAIITTIITAPTLTAIRTVAVDMGVRARLQPLP